MVRELKWVIRVSTVLVPTEGRLLIMNLRTFWNPEHHDFPDTVTSTLASLSPPRIQEDYQAYAPRSTNDDTAGNTD